MSKMLRKSEYNCNWKCCPEFGHTAEGKTTARRLSRRKEDRKWRKDWGVKQK